MLKAVDHPYMEAIISQLQELPIDILKQLQTNENIKKNKLSIKIVELAQVYQELDDWSKKPDSDEKEKRLYEAAAKLSSYRFETKMRINMLKTFYKTRQVLQKNSPNSVVILLTLRKHKRLPSRAPPETIAKVHWHLIISGESQLRFDAMTRSIGVRPDTMTLSERRRRSESVIVSGLTPMQRVKASNSHLHVVQDFCNCLGGSARRQSFMLRKVSYFTTVD